MEPFEFMSTSRMSVRLRTANSEGSIIVVIMREAIDDRFRLISSTEELRTEIVLSNLGALADLVRVRIARKEWTRETGSDPRRVVIRLDDLESVPLKGPL